MANLEIKNQFTAAIQKINVLCGTLSSSCNEADNAIIKKSLDTLFNTAKDAKSQFLMNPYHAVMEDEYAKALDSSILAQMQYDLIKIKNAFQSDVVQTEEQRSEIESRFKIVMHQTSTFQLSRKDNPANQKRLSAVQENALQLMRIYVDYLKRDKNQQADHQPA